MHYFNFLQDSFKFSSYYVLKMSSQLFFLHLYFQKITSHANNGFTTFQNYRAPFLNHHYPNSLGLRFSIIFDSLHPSFSQLLGCANLSFEKPLLYPTQIIITTPHQVLSHSNVYIQSLLHFAIITFSILVRHHATNLIG